MEQKLIKLTVTASMDDILEAIKMTQKQIKETGNEYHPMSLLAFITGMLMIGEEQEMCNVDLSKNPCAEDAQRILQGIILTQATKRINITREEFEKMKKEHENGGGLTTYQSLNRFVRKKRTKYNPNRDLNLSRFVTLFITAKNVRICKHCG